MLLEFSCSNHKSIKEPIVFSTMATSDDSLNYVLKNYGKYRFLRSAVIYGANGSGKSNFLDAIEFMKTLVCNSMKYQPGQGIMQFRHKLNGIDIPSQYNIQFVKEDIRYAYGFSIVKQNVVEEYLYYFPNGRQVKIFERDNMEIKIGSKFKNRFELVMEVLKENRLFLSCAANYSKVSEVEQAFLFFAEDLVIYRPGANNWMEYSIQTLQDKPDVKKVFLEILKEMGTGIKDVKVKIDSVKIANFPQNVPGAIKNFMMTQKEGKIIEARVVYEKFETDLMYEESVGMKKLFEIICPIIDIIKNGKVLICDELETSLHEALVYKIIETFHKAKSKYFPQLIFSTHDTSLLNDKLFRRDQIWFTQLKEDRSTDLYSLSEIRNVRKTENMEKGYISGKYGAIPMLNNSFVHVFSEMD